MNLPYPGADATLPRQCWGARVEGSIELLTDAGEHLAFAVVLQLVHDTYPHTVSTRVALWWDRHAKPARFELTPIGDLEVG